MTTDHGELHRFIGAASAGDLEALREMATANPELIDAPLPTGERAIHAAHYAGRTAVCDYLYAQGVKRDIFLAIALGHLDEVRAMLEADPALARAVTPGRATTLHTAVFWGYPAIASLLLELGVEVNAANGRASSRRCTLRRPRPPPTFRVTTNRSFWSLSICCSTPARR